MATLITDATQLKAKKVRLILPDGPVIIDKSDAIAKALAEGLDLILVQEGDLPVVKMVDFAKLEYEQQKAQKNNKPKKPKTIQIGPHTQEFDLKRFALQASKFMAEGHPTSLRMEVRGRDKAFRDLLTNRMAQFIALVPNAKPGKLSINEDGSTYTQSLN